MTHTIQAAINQQIINKIEEMEDGSVNPKWEIFTTQCENVELTVPEFADHINQGHAFCAQHKKRKKNSNFTGINILTVDIDKGTTFEQLLADPFVQLYATIIYTTPSHTSENHRLRLVFLLDRLITDSAEMRMAYQGIIRKFGGDESCKDACRGFFGSTNSNPIILGNVLPEDELAKIIAMGAEKRISDKICSDNGGELGGKATQTSNDPLEKNQMVKLANGTGRLLLLADLPKWTPLHCPKHIDRRPSAYVVTNQHGVNGVRCRTCNAAFWPKSELKRKRKPYNFYDIEQFIFDEDYHQTPANFYDMDAVDADPSLLHEFPGERTSHIFTSQFLPNIPLHEGVTFVRSPKGSGKTQWLQEIVKRCRDLGQSVLLVGHRQTLIQGIAKRLGLTCYFYSDGDKIKNNLSEMYYAICVDSISKLLKPSLVNKYDVVIIDESEQVFSHLTADTLRGKRRACYQTLAYYLRTAKSIVVSDADLGPITVVTVCNAIKEETKYNFYLNQYKESRCDFQYFENDNHLMKDMIEAIRNGGRYFVASNSKKMAEILVEAIRYEFGDKRKTMLVTSDTTLDSKVRYFVNNIKTEILNYDVILASPTLGTGIDITFDGEAKLIDTVYGFFVPRVNTHFDIDQQLARVRHPQLIKTWVAPDRYGFETEADVIRNEVLDNAALNDMLIAYQDDGTPLLDNEYLNVYSSVTAMQRASKNNLRSNLQNLRERNGWAVQPIAVNPEFAKEGERRTTDAKAELASKRSDAICSAEKIIPEVYQEYYAISKQGYRLTRDEDYSMRRHEIEAFYREQITPELVDRDDNGRYREKVRMMQTYLTPLQNLIDKSSAERKADRFLSDMKFEPLQKSMLYDLLEAAGLADSTTPIKSGVVVSKETLTTFTKMCRARSSKIQELFGIKPHKNTMQTLGKILDLIGLKNCPPVRVKIDKVTIYNYELDMGTWDQISGIINIRLSTSSSAAPALVSTAGSDPSSFQQMMKKRAKKNSKLLG